MSTQIDRAASTLSRFEDVGARLTGGKSDGFLTLAEAEAVADATKAGANDPRLANVSAQDRQALGQTASELVNQNADGSAQWTQAGQNMVSREGTGQRGGFSTGVVPNGALVNSAAADRDIVNLGVTGMIGPNFGAATVANATLKASANGIFSLDRSDAREAKIRDQIDVPLSLPEISADAPYNVAGLAKAEAPAKPDPLPAFPDNPLLQMQPGASQKIQGPDGQNWTVTASLSNMPPVPPGGTILRTAQSENAYTISIDGALPGTNSTANVSINRQDGSMTIDTSTFWKPGDAQLFGAHLGKDVPVPSPGAFSQQIADYFTQANGGEGISSSVPGRPNTVLWAPGTAPEGQSYQYQP